MIFLQRLQPIGPYTLANLPPVMYTQYTFQVSYFTSIVSLCHFSKKKANFCSKN